MELDNPNITNIAGSCYAHLGVYQGHSYFDCSDQKVGQMREIMQYQKEGI